jgi:hypothetical protein
VREHMRECGEITVRLAKDISPYQTGHNRRSITADFYENGALTASVTEGEFQSDPTAPPASGRSNFGLKESLLEQFFSIYTQSGYGGYLELGTAKMDARPYIYPAFQRSVEFLKQSLQGSAN